MVAAEAKRQLRALARPAGEFDASRYFRGADDLEFYNVGTPRIREMAATIVRSHREAWTVTDAMVFADTLIVDPVLEVKGIAVEVVARFHREFTPSLLPKWKAWLARDCSTNWATTDSICGVLIGPLLARHPELIDDLRPWVSHRNLWVRRAAAVSLVALARRGQSLGAAYEVAERLHADPHDLIHKAVGWLLREAGKTDMPRLERYLRRRGPVMPRTTVRYALEKFPPAMRRQLLDATRRNRA